MDEEKMQRQMEFIVEQQAQFAAKIGQLEDTTRQISENIVRLGGVVERLSGIVERLVDAIARRLEEMDRRDDEAARNLAALAAAQIQTETQLVTVDKRAAERAAEFDQKFALLTEAQRKTEEGIRSLAATVDRHIAEGHNGRARPEG
jgi:hypothetical protein